jgi:hypothetical protein
MDASKYKEFLGALENPEALERRLIKLGKQERFAFRVSLFLDLVFFFSLAVGLFSFSKRGEFGSMAFLAPMMAISAVVQLVVMKATQSEIRSLLLFRKLREEGSRFS